MSPLNLNKNRWKSSLDRVKSFNCTRSPINSFQIYVPWILNLMFYFYFSHIDYSCRESFWLFNGNLFHFIQKRVIWFLKLPKTATSSLFVFVFGKVELQLSHLRQKFLKGTKKIICLTKAEQGRNINANTKLSSKAVHVSISYSFHELGVEFYSNWKKTSKSRDNILLTQEQCRVKLPIGGDKFSRYTKISSTSQIKLLNLFFDFIFLGF